jgi:hypothetical protein
MNYSKGSSLLLEKYDIVVANNDIRAEYVSSTLPPGDIRFKMRILSWKAISQITLRPFLNALKARTVLKALMTPVWAYSVLPFYLFFFFVIFFMLPFPLLLRTWLVNLI